MCIRWLAVVVAVFIGAAVAHADSIDAKTEAGCKTALDLIASQNPNLPMSPVFQEIFNSPSLKGTLLVPTAAAWDTFFTTITQRQGNPQAPAMVARYGQVMLYHLAQGIDVPIAQPTPGAPKFSVDTASTFQCSVGPGLPNNKWIVNKSPEGIYILHGATPGKATITSQPIKYCGGEAYLVDTVLNPCADVASIMGEIANVPSACKNNVEGVLARDGLSSFKALLLATGINQPIFSAARNFTIFAPSDEAIQAARLAGSFNYPELFAKDKAKLAGIVAYHVVPQVGHVVPGPKTVAMETMLSQGHGKASCQNPAPLSWRADGFVYGGSGAAKVSGTYDQGCTSVIFQVDGLLQPCCTGLTELTAGMMNTAAKDSHSAKALAALHKRIDGGGAHSTLVVPTEEAWVALLEEAQAANKTLTAAQLDALFAYLYSGADASSVVDTAAPVKTALSSVDGKVLKALCPKGTRATLVFAYDNVASAPLGASPAALGASTGAVAAAPQGTAVDGALATPAATTTLGAPPAAVAVVPPAAAAMPGFTAGDAAAAVPPVGGATTVLPGATAVVAPAAEGNVPSSAFPATAGANLPGATPAPLPGLRRRLQQGLQLPTSFAVTGGKKNSIFAGPVTVYDAVAIELGAARGISVASVAYGCDGAVLHVNAVPLPCNILGRTVAREQSPLQGAPPTPLPMATINPALVNTSGVPGAVGPVTAASAAPARTLSPPAMAASAAATVLLAALVL